MILHLGGVFGDKAATLDRFRENYKRRLSQGIKDRLVLENDDVSWSVHDLLPLCEELNIPLVLDFHHHNIIFDAEQIREGTKDIMELYPRILATWERKKITPKMHYSEPTPSAITGRQRRKHNPRVASLPPCPPTMDLMIEAKDKEQAVFELMRTYKLPGFDSINDMIPHVRKDENKPVRVAKKKPTGKKTKKSKKGDDDENDFESPNDDPDPTEAVIPDDQIGMGGPEGRVYWPPGMEHWLRPMKKVVKPKAPPTSKVVEKDSATPAAKKRKAATEASEAAGKLESELQQPNDNDTVMDNSKATTQTATSTSTKNPKSRKQGRKGTGKKIIAKINSSDDKDDDKKEEVKEDDDDDDQDTKGFKEPIKKTVKPPSRQRSMRAKKTMSYAEYTQGIDVEE
jgi:UV DNA damage endonuclease